MDGVGEDTLVSGIGAVSWVLRLELGESIEERGVTESSWLSLSVVTLVLTARVVLRRIIRQKERRKEKKWEKETKRRWVTAFPPSLVLLPLQIDSTWRTMAGQWTPFSLFWMTLSVLLGFEGWNPISAVAAIKEDNGRPDIVCEWLMKGIPWACSDITMIRESKRFKSIFVWLPWGCLATHSWWQNKGRQVHSLKTPSVIDKRSTYSRKTSPWRSAGDSASKSYKERQNKTVRPWINVNMLPWIHAETANRWLNNSDLVNKWKSSSMRSLHHLHPESILHWNVQFN